MSSSGEIITPAALSYFYIYNPTLADSEEHEYRQILFARRSHDNLPDGSLGSADASRRGHSNQSKAQQRKLRNVDLRRVGLARGMVQFASDFADGAPVQDVETDSGRSIIRELEPGYWLVLAVNFTCIQHQSRGQGKHDTQVAKPRYIAKDVIPANLITQQVLRAHDVFLLHYGVSLSQIFEKTSHKKLCDCLEQYWNVWLDHWHVILHGNPTVDIYNGIKLAAGGELGIGPDEHEWGSSERELLEGIVYSIDGLKDLLVSRFTSIAPDLYNSEENISNVSTDFYCHLPSDGLIFGGIGSLTRPSVRRLSAWMENVALYGRKACGPVRISNAGLQKASCRDAYRSGKKVSEPHVAAPHSTIPGPVTTLSKKPTKSPKASGMVSSASTLSTLREYGGAELMKYLTLGIYSSSWSQPAQLTKENHTPKIDGHQSGSAANNEEGEAFFVVGLQDALAEAGELKSHTGQSSSHAVPVMKDFESNESRGISTKEVYCQLIPSGQSMESDTAGSDDIKQHRLRAVLYVLGPFMFTFLFDVETESLDNETLYHSLHHRLSPLYQNLLQGTDPAIISRRLRDSIARPIARDSSIIPSLRDIIYDPKQLTIRCSIPNLPDQIPTTAIHHRSASQFWTRAEALSVHLHIINLVVSGNPASSKDCRSFYVEQTSKSSKSWWVSWLRIAETIRKEQAHELKMLDAREAIIIHKSQPEDRATLQPRSFGYSFGRRSKLRTDDQGASRGSSSQGPVSFDARQYIHALSSLNR